MNSWSNTALLGKDLNFSLKLDRERHFSLNGYKKTSIYAKNVFPLA